MEEYDKDTEINWLYERVNHTVRWQEKCRERWKIAEDLIMRGFVLAFVQPLSKKMVKTGTAGSFSQLIKSVATLRKYTEEGCQFEDYNYGVVTGFGKCVVVDLDVKEDRNGLSNFQSLGDRYEFPTDTFGGKVITPRGGVHLYYGYDERLVTADNVVREHIAKSGIDIASSMTPTEPHKCCIGPGSVTAEDKLLRTINGEYYLDPDHPIQTVSTLAEFHRVPEEFVTLVVDRPDAVTGLSGGTVSKHPTFYNNNPRGGENVQPGDDEYVAKLGELQDMLSEIPCKDMSYDEWLRIGAAIHWWSRIVPDMDHVGFELWNDWSASDEGRYDYKTCRMKWDSFSVSHPRPTTVGTIVMIARRYDYKPSHTGKFLMAMEELQSTTPWCLLGGEAKFLFLDSEGGVRPISESAALSYYANKLIVINNKEVNPLRPYIRWTGRVDFEGMSLYPPGSPPCPAKVFNTWRGYKLKPNGEPPERFFELFNSMFTEDQVREWAHDWFAHLVQTPGEKIDTALILHGAEGTGKGTLMNVFRKMFLLHNTVQVDHTEQFMSKFNARYAQSVLTIINEAIWSGSHQHANILKSMVSEEWTQYEEKNVPMWNGRNCMRVVVLTNDDWAVPAGREARRYCVARVPLVRKSFDLWWKETRHILGLDDSIAGIMNWYMHRKITNNLHKVPHTDSLMTQKKYTLAKYKSDTDEVYAAVISHLMERGHAIKREGKTRTGEFYDGYLISTDQVKRAYRYHKDRTANDNFVYSMKMWVREKLQISIITGIKARANGHQKQASAWPSLEEMAQAMARYELIDVEDINCGSEWVEDESEW